MPRKARRQAIVFLSVTDLRSLLGLPGDVDVVSVYSTPDPPCIGVILQSDHFEEVADNSNAPRVPHRCVTGSDATGKQFVRFELDYDRSAEMAFNRRLQSAVTA